MPNENETKVHTNVSPSLHPSSTAPWEAPLMVDGKSLPALTASKAALTALYSALGDCEEAVTTARVQYGVGPVVDGANIRAAIPEDRANALAIDLGAKFNSTAKIFDQHLGTVAETVDSLKAQIATALTNPKKDVLTATEASDLRKFVRDLPQGERLNWLHARCEEGDHAVVSAVLASHWASGLDKADAERLFDIASFQFAPTQRAQLDAAKALHSHLIDNSKRFVDRFRAIAPVPKEDSPAVKARKKLVEA